ncbi:MAG: hypothetical protein RL021_1095 [Bacteroidota bacterium]
MLLILASGSGCQVEILPARTADDGYSRLTVQERSAVLPVAETELAEGLAEEGCISLADWRSSDVVKELESHRYTWLLFGAGWCPHSQQALRLMAASDTFLLQMKVQTVALYRTYDYRYLKRKCREYGIRFKVGFISNSEYGSLEEEKQRRFLEELTGAAESSCVPFNVLMDHNGNVLARHCGPVRDVREFLRMAIQEEYF